MNFKISSGELRHPIIIQEHKKIKDKEDFLTKYEWVDKLNTRAKVLNVRGEEYLQAQGVGSKIEKTFYIRASRNTVITRKDRIVFKEQLYDIEYINDIEEVGTWLEIKVKRCE